MLSTAKTMLETLQQTIDLLKDTQLSESEMSPIPSIEATPPPAGLQEPSFRGEPVEVRILALSVYYMYTEIYSMTCAAYFFNGCRFPLLALPCFRFPISFFARLTMIIISCIQRCTVENLYKNTPELRGTSINRALPSVPNATFVYLTTSEMRTPHYSGHFSLLQWCLD